MEDPIKKSTDKAGKDQIPVSIPKPKKPEVPSDDFVDPTKEKKRRSPTKNR